MSLRLRLALAFGLLALIVAALYGSLVYSTHQQQQWSRLRELLQEELDRLTEVLAEPSIGAPLISDPGPGQVVQLVSDDGRVLLPRGRSNALPARAEPSLVEYGGTTYLSGMRSLAVGQSVRVGLDVSDELASSGLLARQLITLGLACSVLAAIVGALLANRALTPLVQLARQARRVDPAYPDPVSFRGPSDEVAEVASALNTALAGIRRRRDEERAFLAEVAHELAAPLTLVSAHLDGAQRRSADPPRRDEHLQAAREAATELLLTSQDLLALARGELDRPVENEIVDLAGLLRRLEVDYPGIAVEAEAARVAGSRHQLLQAIRNLVRNAVQANGSTHGVAIAVTAGEQWGLITVSDQGPGIPEERLDRIFERYYSGSSGSGVGLAVVKRVVEQHGGEVDVVTGPAGSRFTIRLPLLEARLVDEHSGRQDENSGNEPAGAGRTQ